MPISISGSLVITTDKGDFRFSGSVNFDSPKSRYKYLAVNEPPRANDFSNIFSVLLVNLMVMQGGSDIRSLVRDDYQDFNISFLYYILRDRYEKTFPGIMDLPEELPESWDDLNNSPFWKLFGIESDGPLKILKIYKIIYVRNSVADAYYVDYTVDLLNNKTLFQYPWEKAEMFIEQTLECIYATDYELIEKQDVEDDKMDGGLHHYYRLY